MKPLEAIDPSPIQDAVDLLASDRDPHVRALCALAQMWLDDWDWRTRRDDHLPDMEKVALAFMLDRIGAANEDDQACLTEAGEFAETHLRRDIARICRAIARRQAKEQPNANH